jgi:hypothetical protein
MPTGAWLRQSSRRYRHWNAEYNDETGERTADQPDEDRWNRSWKRDASRRDGFVDETNITTLRECRESRGENLRAHADIHRRQPRELSLFLRDRGALARQPGELRVQHAEVSLDGRALTSQRLPIGRRERKKLRHQRIARVRERDGLW